MIMRIVTTTNKTPAIGTSSAMYLFASPVDKAVEVEFAGAVRLASGFWSAAGGGLVVANHSSQYAAHQTESFTRQARSQSRHLSPPRQKNLGGLHLGLYSPQAAVAASILRASSRTTKLKSN